MFARAARKLISGRDDTYLFERFRPDAEDLVFPREMGLYVHVPFCRSSCPYCPYYKERFEPVRADRYLQALLAEIGFYSQRAKDVTWTSLYIGGGTPTVMMNGLERLVPTLSRDLGFRAPIGLETTPRDLTDDVTDRLVRMGVDLLSVGVQSFDDRNLRAIGRDHRVADIRRGLERLRGAGFKSVNLDLIFMFPGQDREGLRRDLDAALEFDPQQLTCYPLFTFPYTEVGRFKGLERFRLPDHGRRRELYHHLHDYLVERGYARTSVWTFNRPGTAVFSSVTRDHYLGLGPGAGTYTGNGFYFNVFSVDEYVRCVGENRLPIALAMQVSERMSRLFWFYWRLYETDVPLEGWRGSASAFAMLSKLGEWTGFAEPGGGARIRLTRRGAHWIHLVQNRFALDYVNKIWTACRENPWPERIAL